MWVEILTSKHGPLQSVPESFPVGERLQGSVAEAFLAFFGFDVAGDQFVEDDGMLDIFDNVEGEVFDILVGQVRVLFDSLDQIAEHRRDRKLMSGADGAEGEEKIFSAGHLLMAFDEGGGFGGEFHAAPRLIGETEGLQKIPIKGRMAAEDGMLAELVVEDGPEEIGGILVGNFRQQVGHVVHKNLDQLIMLKAEGLDLLDRQLLGGEPLEEGMMHRVVMQDLFLKRMNKCRSLHK